MYFKYQLDSIATISYFYLYIKGSGFCGIYSMELPKRCWSADGNKLYFHTVRRIYQVNCHNLTLKNLLYHNPNINVISFNICFFETKDIYEVNTIDKKLSCITKGITDFLFRFCHNNYNLT